MTGKTSGSETSGGLTRRDMLKVGGAVTFAGYAVGVEKALAQVINTDTTGITTGDFEIKIGDYGLPVYEARPASGPPAPIVVCISEIWGLHEWVRDVTRRFAKAGYYAVAPELFKREGGVAQLPNIQDILKIVFAVPLKQMLGDVTATTDWAKKRPGARADRVGVTAWCWGGGMVYQVAATNPDIKAAVAWYGPPGRPFADQPAPVSGFDVAKDIKAPLLGLYGEMDKNPTPADAQKLGDLVRQHNPNVEIVVYPGAGHGFFADYRPSFNAAASTDGWKRCTDWFDKYLKT